MFGKPIGHRAEKPIENIKDPDEMTVNGIFFNSNGSDDIAFISVNDSETEAYNMAENDNQNSLFKVLRIEKNYVIVEKSGQRFRLSLKDFKSDDVNIATKEPITKTPVDSTSKQTDSSYVFSDIGLTKATEGNISGYKLTENSKQLQMRLGLDKGDVLVSINGYELGNKDSDHLAMKSLVESNRGVIEVYRDGNRFTLTPPIHK